MGPNYPKSLASSERLVDRSLANLRVLTFLAEFMELHPEYIDPHNAMDFLSDDGGNSYNLCHCTTLT